jgi:hypothetical protein
MDPSCSPVPTTYIGKGEGSYSEIIWMIFKVLIAIKYSKISKKDCLCPSSSADFYEVAKWLAAPESIESILYSELLSIFQQHYTPNCIIMVESHPFHRWYKRECESGCQFICELCKLATKNNFGVCLDQAMWVQFLVGLHLQEMAKRLLREMLGK